MSNIATLPSLSHKLVSVVCSGGRGLFESSITSPALNYNHDDYYVRKKKIYRSHLEAQKRTELVNMRKLLVHY
jgi:hypothetical protein